MKNRSKRKCYLCGTNWQSNRRNGTEQKRKENQNEPNKMKDETIRSRKEWNFVKQLGQSVYHMTLPWQESALAARLRFYRLHPVPKNARYFFICLGFFFPNLFVGFFYSKNKWTIKKKKQLNKDGKYFKKEIFDFLILKDILFPSASLFGIELWQLPPNYYSIQAKTRDIFVECPLYWHVVNLVDHVTIIYRNCALTFDSFSATKTQNIDK